MYEIDQQSAVERTVGDIRTLMRVNGLGVGDPLPTEAALASHCGASRNTVREALRTLKAYGIVETRQKSGAVITDRRQDAVMNVFSFAMDLSVESFRDIQGFRQLIETSIGDRLVARIDAATIDAAARANAQMAQAADAASAAPLDFGFHRVLIDAVGNTTLSEVYRMFKPIIINAIEMGKSRDLPAAIEEHELILKALRERDALAYAFYATSHARFGMACLSETGAQSSLDPATVSQGSAQGDIGR